MKPTIKISELASLIGRSEFARRLGKCTGMVDYWAERGLVRFVATANGRLFFAEDVQRVREHYERRPRKAEPTIET
jgi:predicted site-specific integrase-resolvase